MALILALVAVTVAAVALAAGLVIIWAVCTRLRRENAGLTRRLMARREASDRSVRSVNLGLISEQLAPALPGFPYNVKDARWLGGTVDMIVWDGLEDGRDVEVVFLEIKTGKERLRPRQRRIKAAVDAGRVSFQVYRPDAPPAPAADDRADDGELTAEELDSCRFLSDAEVAAMGLDDVTYADEPGA